jgi:hypothetical protein
MEIEIDQRASTRCFEPQLSFTLSSRWTKLERRPNPDRATIWYRRNNATTTFQIHLGEIDDLILWNN